MHVTNADNHAPTQAAAAKKLLTLPADGFAVCPVREVIARIGDKWSVLTVLHLGSAELLRFNELRRSIPDISQRMLTVTLRALEHEGLVERTVHAEVPPRVEYRLTEMGQSLLGALLELGNWATRNGAALQQARQQADLKRGVTRN